MDDLDRSSQIINNLLNETSKDYGDISQAIQNKENHEISQTINNLNETYTKSSILKTSIDSSVLRFRNRYKRETSPRLSPLKKPKFYQWIFLDEEKKKEIENEEKKEKEVKEKIEKSFEIEIEDSKPKEMIGDVAIEDYYKHYKKLKKVQDQNNLKYLPLNYHPTKQSAYTALLSKSEASLVLPSKVGLIKRAGDLKQINIKNFKFGDAYTQVITEGLKCLPNVQFFNMSGNRISEKGAESLLSQISKNAKVIDLSLNNIGKLGVDHLCHSLVLRECKIESLNLENNKLGDKISLKLFESLQTNTTLRKLNMSKNFLTDIVADSIKALFQKNYFIQEIYLHWNMIKTQGGIKIFKGILENESLMVFDMSWNSIGNGTPSVVPEILELFKINDKIIHLDLSNNNFTREESKEISDGLANNHSIYGFHFVGNYGYVDSRGFLIVNPNDERDLSEMHVSHRINGVNLVQEGRKKKIDEVLKDCCWICDGWLEATFSWIPGSSGDEENEPIFIHFDFEYWKSNYMGSKNKSGNHSYRRVIPPGPMSFFFTAIKQHTHSKLYQTFEALEPFIKNVRFQTKSWDIDILTRNIIENPKKTDVIGLAYVPNITIPPRTLDPVYVAPKIKKDKRVWSFPISIFKDWRRDDEELLKRCFEYDWDCSRIPRLVKNEDDQKKVKELLRSIYKHYKEAYKYFAGLTPIGDTWCISMLGFTDFLNSANIIDGKTLKLSDVDIKFIATSSSSEIKSNPRNPERGLIRCQLMESLVRIAEEKYMKNQGIGTFEEAVSKILNEHCVPVFTQYNSQKWRDEKYWCEECDDVLKKHRQILDTIYNKYSEKKVRPGEKKFMCLEELIDMCKHADLFDENFVERDVNLAFNMSMMTQVDEITKENLFRMTFVEFLEALARIADKLSPLKIGGATSDMPYEKRNQQPLYYKIEALLMILLKNCCPVSMRESYPIPQVSMFDTERDDEFLDIEEEY